MIESQKAKIRPGMGPKRDALCYRVEREIVIPAGTILRQAAKQRGGPGILETPIGFGKDFTAHLVVPIHTDAETSGYFKKVIA